MQGKSHAGLSTVGIVPEDKSDVLFLSHGFCVAGYLSSKQETASLYAFSSSSAHPGYKTPAHVSLALHTSNRLTQRSAQNVLMKCCAGDNGILCGSEHDKADRKQNWIRRLKKNKFSSFLHATHFYSVHFPKRHFSNSKNANNRLTKRTPKCVPFTQTSCIKCTQASQSPPDRRMN